jgi:aspartate carbamoyltransferase catalytic subunit
MNFRLSSNVAVAVGRRCFSSQRLKIATSPPHPPKDNPIRALGDILDPKQFDRKTLEYLFSISKEMRKVIETGSHSDILKGKVLASVFFEPSTRTRTSFISSMLQLGGGVVSVDRGTADTQRGESWQDTIRSLENFADIIAVRHPQLGSAALAAKYSNVPVINAGDGSGQHPTQALLDLLCIEDKLGKIDGLNITIVGDLKYGRTVHSLSHLLSLYNVNINYVSQPQLSMPSDIVHDLEDVRTVKVTESAVLEPLLAKTDVLYVTRVQKERFGDLKNYELVKDYYTINPEVMKQLNKHAIVMHPLPRIHEISEQVDDDPRCVYFQQPAYGTYVRMALLAGLLGQL